MHTSRIALALLLFCSGPLFAKAPAAYHYLPPDTINLRAVLPDPPAPGSPANNADLRAVLAYQVLRKPAQVARIDSEEDLTPASFAGVFGPWFTRENLPLTFTLLDNASADARAISASAKDLWRRPRPPLQSRAIHPAGPVPPSGSYPSFHALRGALWAKILAEIEPDLKSRILVRGRQIGEDRVIAGVHFPTDVAAGQKLGFLLADDFLKNPAFQRDLARVRVELATARPRSASWFSKHGRVDDPFLGPAFAAWQ
jgi:membrane-associated phospholipid phosphatase